jgi:hypothetical protein
MKPSGNLEYCFSGCLAFSQGQIPTHTGKVWSEAFAPVPWSFLTRPGTNSHRHGPIAGSDKIPLFKQKQKKYQRENLVNIQCGKDYFALKSRCELMFS